MASEQSTPPYDEGGDSQKGHTENNIVDSEKSRGDSEKTNEVHIHDIDEKGPVKGDFSDGRVNWTSKQIVATIALCGLYVGMYGEAPDVLDFVDRRARVSDSAILCRGCSLLYRSRRGWSCKSFLGSRVILTCFLCHLSILWLSSRHLWKTKHHSHRWLCPYYWQHYYEYGTFICSSDIRHGYHWSWSCCRRIDCLSGVRMF